MKTSTSFGLSPECKRLLKKLATRIGISQASVIEMLVREMAEEKDITLESEEERIITIYGLTSPGTGKIQYIGRSQDPDARFRKHLYTSQRNHHGTKDSPLYGWLRDLNEQGLRPCLVIIEEVAEDNGAKREQHWIAHYGLDNLHNIYTSR